jgi:ParB family chromosome partitioning protein
VVLNHDGAVRIERGFVRAEDDKQPEPGASNDQTGERVSGDGEAVGGASPGVASETEDNETDEVKPLSDALVRDLTAHRTLALRLALGESPDVALIAMTHALAARTFYHGHDVGSCLDVKPSSQPLGGHADGIEDTAAAKKLAERHESWARQMPGDVAGLWGLIIGLDHDSRMALFAYCAALTAFAVRLPWDKTPCAWATADVIAQATGLDMAACWQPTVRSYFGRVSKARILEAVREAVSDEAAEQMEGMKKQPMAEAAERLLVGAGWLPALLRTPGVGSDTASAPHAAPGEPYPVAAE